MRGRVLAGGNGPPRSIIRVIARIIAPPIPVTSREGGSARFVTLPISTGGRGLSRAGAGHRAHRMAAATRGTTLFTRAEAAFLALIGALTLRRSPGTALGALFLRTISGPVALSRAGTGTGAGERGRRTGASLSAICTVAPVTPLARPLPRGLAVVKGWISTKGHTG